MESAMSAKHPIIAVTGSSGAGTTLVQHAFAEIFRRNELTPAMVHGDAFFRHEREKANEIIATSWAQGKPVSHFGPELNMFEKLEAMFADYAANGVGKVRHYVKDVGDATTHGVAPGEFTEWQPLPTDTDLLLYEGLHGGVAASTWTRRQPSPAHRPMDFEERRDADRRGVDVAQHVDLLIGVVPVINLEWIQKIHADCSAGQCSVEDVTSLILRRMNDYIHFIVPQFSITDINVQRVPLVDTSDPFIARDIPTTDESVLVFHFRDPEKHDFPCLMGQIEGAFMSRPNTMVVPGGELSHALEVVCTPLIRTLTKR
jgi:phosphoribulokinase